MPNKGTITFVGTAGSIPSIVSASFTLGHGVTPSFATITAPPQPAFVSFVGDLLIAYDGQSIIFPDCRIDSAHLRVGPDGQQWQYKILDRRWKWAFGRIDGTYNRRKPNGEIDTEGGQLQKSARELCQILLDEMGETDTNVLAVPDDVFPEIHWDVANPAAELQKLADEHGCRVVLRTDNAVHVVKAGVGLALPDGNNPGVTGAVNATFAADIPERPDKITIVGAPVRFEAKFRLEPVGTEADDDIQPIDDLSYNPDGAGTENGWTDEYSPSFTSLTTDEDRELAVRTVFKWFRVLREESLDDSVHLIKLADLFPELGDQHPEVPSIEEFNVLLEDIWRILPINDVLLTTFLDKDNVARPRPAIVTGEHWPGNMSVTDTTLCQVIDEDDWTIDKERGIVVFNRPIIKITGASATDKYKSNYPNLLLQTSFSVRNLTTRQFIRYQRTRDLPDANGTEALIVLRDDLVNRKVITYDSDCLLLSVGNNDADVDAIADLYLDAIEASLTPEPAADVTYAGLIDIQPDGAIYQVGWDVSLSGAFTRASRNVEWARHLPDYRQRAQTTANLRYAPLTPEALEARKKTDERAGAVDRGD